MSEQDSTVTGAQSLIKSLEAAGATDVFGIPGGAILPAYDPLMDSSIRHILGRPAQGAGHARPGDAAAPPGETPRPVAEAFYSAATGRPGPVLVDVAKSALQSQTTFDWPAELHLP